MTTLTTPEHHLPDHVPGEALHDLPAHEAIVLLGSHPHAGLDEDEVRARRDRFGPNVLPEGRRRGPLVRFLVQFHHPLIYVLLAATAVTLALDELVDAAVIMGVVLVNAIIGFVQESRAEQALAALQAMARTGATVVRDGETRRVDSADLVPGDVVLLGTGDKVPADLRLITVSELQIDESALTGESVPVMKEDLVLPRETVLADRRNVAYSGTLVTAGSGRGIVVGTGTDTELGRIHQLVGAARGVQTPLTRKMTTFTHVLTVVILALAAVTLLVGVSRGEELGSMVTAAVALAVGAIPEGLPAVVTITLAIGVARMARRNSIIRKLPAVETLGGTTVICTDKTGTLTRNQMTVRAVVAGGETIEVTGGGYAPEGDLLAGGAPIDVASHPALGAVLTAGVLCNDSRLVETEAGWQVEGDPTEGALVVAARKAGLDLAAVATAGPRRDTLPFASERQLMATLHDAPEGRVVYVKGALEVVLRLAESALDRDGEVVALDADAALAEQERLARDGLRVLAFARAATDGDTIDEDDLGGLTLLGLQAMYDPPRPEAIAAVAAAQKAGIAVKMITGDHPATARAIAGQIGLDGEAHDDGGVRTISGADLAKVPDEDLVEVAEHTTVFARVTPEQKLLLVEALQQRGHVVAVTGDGVNDAPALKQADIGVAMGRDGTEVAKEAADMILTDDNFASIEAAVEEGRGVFDNLTKFIVWTLPTNLGEGLLILSAIAIGGALPILPTQLLWINMATAVALGLMLAFEPKEPGIMERSPRDPRQSLLTGWLVGRILMVGAIIVVGAFWLHHWELDRGASLAEARTVAVNVVVAVQLFYLFNCRSLEHSMFWLGVFTNRLLILGVGLMILLQLGFTYLPFMNTIFHTAPIDAAAWVRIVLVGAAAYGVIGLEKWTRRTLQARRERPTG
jgi:cation-transporting P-type ATPase F